MKLLNSFEKARSFLSQPVSSNVSMAVIMAALWFVGTGILLSQPSGKDQVVGQYPTPLGTFQSLRVNRDAWFPLGLSIKTATPIANLEVQGSFGGRFDGVNKGNLAIAYLPDNGDPAAPDNSGYYAVYAAPSNCGACGPWTNSGCNSQNGCADGQRRQSRVCVDLSCVACASASVNPFCVANPSTRCDPSPNPACPPP